MTSAASDERVLTRQALPSCTLDVLRPHSGAKPAILLVQWGGTRLLVKDFARAPWLIRNLYGRWVVANETRIYRRLAGVRGVPAFHARLDRFAFAVEYIDAPSLKKWRKKTLPAAVFDRLAELQARLHERGVVHLDAHQRKNILLADDGQPFVVDFATSLYLGKGWVSRKLLLPFFARADRLGLAKLKARYSAEPPPPFEARRHTLRWAIGWLWPHTAIRRLRRIIRRRRRRAAGLSPPRDGG